LDKKILDINFADVKKNTLSVKLNKDYQIVMSSKYENFYKYLFGMLGKDYTYPITKVGQYKVKTIALADYFNPESMENPNAQKINIYPQEQTDVNTEWILETEKLEKLFKSRSNKLLFTVKIVKRQNIEFVKVFKQLSKLKSTKFQIPIQSYGSVKAITDNVNSILKANYQNIGISIDNEERVSVNVPNTHTLLLFKDGKPNSLGSILGFSNAQIRDGINDATVKADKIAKTPEINTFYIFSDVIIDSSVGNGNASLLRLLSNLEEKNKTKIIQRNFGRPHYLKCSNNFINTIEIIILSERNEAIEFANRNTTIVLHFKYACPNNGK